MLLDCNRLVQRFVRRFTRRTNASKVLGVSPPITTLPPDHIAALQSLADRDAFKDPAYLRRRDGVDYTGVPPWIAEFLRAFQAELGRYAIPMVVSEIYRDPERQKFLKGQGRSKAGAGQSPHQYGLAFDLIHYRKGWDITPKQWAVIGAIGKEVARKRKLPMEWGGDWRFYDPAHWQLEGWKLFKPRLDQEPGWRPEGHEWTALADIVLPKLNRR